jgi:hypothetical protein
LDRIDVFFCIIRSLLRDPSPKLSFPSFSSSIMHVPPPHQLPFNAYLANVLPLQITQHASNPDFIRRAIAEDDLDQRLTCDHCKMTIFTGVWICRCCGREYCFGQ